MNEKKKISQKQVQTVTTQQLIQVGIFWQALVATLGSLYFSTFGDPILNLSRNMFIHANGGFIPCTLCWWARILMYPLVLISAVGILKNDKKFTDYVLVLAIPGVFLEMYHYALQKGVIQTELNCTSANPCNAMSVNYFGFITIPFLCLIAFSVIVCLSLYNTYLNKKNS